MTVLTLLLLSALPAQGASGNPCASPTPPIERCRERYLPVPQAHSTPPADVELLTQLAQNAIADERAALEQWLEAQKAHSAARDAVKARLGYFQGKEREKAKKALAEAAERYRQAASVLKMKRESSDTAVTAATDAVVRSYGLTPPKTDFNDTQAYRHQLQAWSPIFSRREVYDSRLGRWRMRTTKEQIKEDAKNAAKSRQTGVYLGAQTGETSAYDGELVILPSAFSSPENLAGTVLHETSHWVDVMASGGLGKHQILSPAAKFQTEVDAYRREAEFFRRMGKVTESANLAAVAEQFSRQVLVAQNRRLTWSDVRTKEAYRSWLGTDWLLRNQQAAPADSLDYAGLESEALRDIQNGAAAFQEKVRTSSEARLREAEGSVEHGERERGVQVTQANAALACGLRLGDTPSRTYLSDETPPAVIRFQDSDFDAFKASLLLLTACYASADEPPCVDAVDILESRWEDPAFRARLSLMSDSAEGPSHCVAGLIGEMKRPRKYKDLIRARDRYWRGWRRRNQQPVPDEPRPDARGLPPTRRPPREDDGGGRREDVPWCLQAPGRRCIR